LITIFPLISRLLVRIYYVDIHLFYPYRSSELSIIDDIIKLTIGHTRTAAFGLNALFVN